MMKKRLYTTIATITVALLGITDAVAENTGVHRCDKDVPWLTRDTAALVLRHIDKPDGMLGGLTTDSPMLMIQLALWADAMDFHGAHKYTEHFKVDELMDVESKAVNSILWLLSYSSSGEVGIQISDAQRAKLRAWANNIMPKYPVRQLDIVMIKQRLFGGEAFPLAVLKGVDSRIWDASILFHIAGQLQQRGKYKEAHQALVKSIESGATKSFLGLGLLEAQHFPMCEERAGVYIKIFKALWGEKSNESDNDM